jgi:hypothetical protein
MFSGLYTSEVSSFPLRILDVAEFLQNSRLQNLVGTNIFSSSTMLYELLEFDIG